MHIQIQIPIPISSLHKTGFIPLLGSSRGAEKIGEPVDVDQEAEELSSLHLKAVTPLFGLGPPERRVSLGIGGRPTSNIATMSLE